VAVKTTKRKSSIAIVKSPIAIAATLLVALCGCGGSSSGTGATSPGDFAIQAFYPTVFLPIGFTSQQQQLSVIAIGGYNQSVSVSLTGLPQGVTANPAGPFTIAPGSSQLVTFSATTSAQAGVQQVTVQGVSGSVSHSTTMSLSTARLSYAYLATTATGGGAPFHLLGYAVDANTRSLSVVQGAQTTLADQAIQMAVAPESGGSFLYALTSTGQPSYSLLSYRIDAASGTLAPVQQLSLGTTTGWWMTLHPSGKFLYLRHNDPNNSQMCAVAYLIDPNTGNLSQSSCTGEDAVGLVIPTPGNFAYLTDPSSSIKLYSVNLNDGSLSSVQSQPLMQYSYISLVHPSGSVLYTGQVQPPNSLNPDCTYPQIWSIDPQSGLLTYEGLYEYSLECWVTLNFMNLQGTFAYSYHQGHTLNHNVLGWSVVKVGLNPPSLTEAGSPGYEPYSFRSLAEPTQGKYFVAYSSAGAIESIPVDANTGALSNPVSSIPVGESLSGFVVASPQN
jgi:hypothetical protein